MSGALKGELLTSETLLVTGRVALTEHLDDLIVREPIGDRLERK
jgi:hypothetical protein